jgi:hypothetical protein
MGNERSGNAVTIEKALVEAQAFDDPQAARQTFSFDIHGAGMLPVQAVFDNRDYMRSRSMRRRPF